MGILFAYRREKTVSQGNLLKARAMIESYDRETKVQQTTTSSQATQEMQQRKQKTGCERGTKW